MTETIEQATPAPQGGGLSEVERISGVFYKPSSTFEDLMRSSNWVVAWLLMFAFSLLFTISVGQKIGWSAVQDNNIKLGPARQREALEKMPADQRDRQLKISLVVTKAFGYGFPVLRLAGWAIVALILWGTFSFGLGSEISYFKSLAIVVYASLPLIIKTVMATVVVWGGPDPDGFFIQNPVGTNPGWYMNPFESSRFLYAVASELDLFYLWTLFLTGLGFSIVGKVKKGTAMATVFGWAILVVLIGAAIGQAFS